PRDRPTIFIRTRRAYAGRLLLLALYPRAVRAARRARRPLRLRHDRHRRHAGQRHGPLGVGGDRRTRLPPRPRCHLGHQSAHAPSPRHRGPDPLPRPPPEPPPPAPPPPP